MENQRFFLYIALAFLLYIIWLTWQQEQLPPPVAQQDDNGSLIENPGGESNATNYDNADDLPDALDAPQSVQNAVEDNKTQEQNRSKKIQVHTDVLKVIIDTRGGDIRQVDLPTYPVSLEKQDEAFRLMRNDARTYIAQSGLRHDKVSGQNIQGVAPTHHEIYTAEQSQYQLRDDQDELEVKLVWRGAKGITVEKIYTFKRAEFVFDVVHRVINNGNSTWVGRQYQQLRHSPVPENRSWLRLPTYTGTAYFDGAYHKHSFDKVGDEPISMQVEGGWIAVLQHYFVSAWIPDETEDNRFYSKEVKAANEKQFLIGMLSEAKNVAPNTSVDFTRRLYTGPKIQEDMKNIAKGLDLSVDYGMFSILSKPLFWLLQWFHKLVGNWGWSIILVTVVIKARFLSFI